MSNTVMYQTGQRVENQDYAKAHRVGLQRLTFVLISVSAPASSRMDTHLPSQAYFWYVSMPAWEMA